MTCRSGLTSAIGGMESLLKSAHFTADVMEFFGGCLRKPGITREYRQMLRSFGILPPWYLSC